MEKQNDQKVQQVPLNDSILLGTKSHQKNTKNIILQSRNQTPQKMHRLPQIDSQKQIKPIFRTKMICWLINQAANWKLTRKTCSLSIEYFDFYLKNCSLVPVDDIQQLGISCLILAKKFNQSKVVIGFCSKKFSANKINAFQLEICQKSSYLLNMKTYVSVMEEILYILNHQIVYNLDNPQQYHKVPLTLIKSKVVSDSELIKYAKDILRIYELINLCIICPLISSFNFQVTIAQIFIFVFNSSLQEGISQFSKKLLTDLQKRMIYFEQINLLEKDSNLLMIIKRIDQILKTVREQSDSLEQFVLKINRQNHHENFYKKIQIYQHFLPYTIKAMKLVCRLKIDSFQ